MTTNPIYELVDDKTFDALERSGLLNPIAIRNFKLKRQFIGLRMDMQARAAIKFLADQELRSYSQIHSVVYHRNSLDDLLRRVMNGRRRPAKRKRRSRRVRRPYIDPRQLSCFDQIDW